MKTCDTCQLAKPMIFKHHIPTGTSIVVNYYCSLPNMYHGKEFNFLPIFEYQECKHYEPRISNNDRSVKYASKCFECSLDSICRKEHEDICAECEAISNQRCCLQLASESR